jgi:hypothetical protein
MADNYMGWGTGTPQQTTSQGVPIGYGGYNPIDTVSPIAQQMWEEEQRRKAMQPAQQPYDYSAGTSFGGASAGAPVLPAPPPAPEVTKPMPYTAPAGGGAATMGYGTGGGTNPYLSGMADDVTRRTNNQTQQLLTGIRGNFVGQNALGSGRQGLAEAGAISGAADNLAGNLTGMYLQDWTGQQNRNLQNDAQRNSYDLGNRQLDQSQARLGADLFTSGMSGEYDPLRNASGIYAPYTGYGTTTSNQSSGGGWQGAAGGLLGGATFARQMGWF